MRRDHDLNYGDEVVLTVWNGMQLRANGYNPDGTEYVRVCDPNGAEVAYFESKQWEDDPGRVMGAIIGALCSVIEGNPGQYGGGRMASSESENVARVVWKDEGEWGFITLLTEADLAARSDGQVGVPYDPDRERPHGTLAEAQALADEHGVPLERG